MDSGIHQAVARIDKPTGTVTLGPSKTKMVNRAKNASGIKQMRYTTVQMVAKRFVLFDSSESS